MPAVAAGILPARCVNADAHTEFESTKMRCSSTRRFPTREVAREFPQAPEESHGGELR
jgi:hypothetical protein